MKKVLAIDMGATSIRGVIGYIQDGKLKTETVDRFTHEIVDYEGRKRWQWDKIVNNIIGMILNHSKEISSVGIDTWGVDFGLINKEGKLIENPVSYRDIKNSLGIKYAEKYMSKEEIFLETGNQIMGMNSLFQLLTYRKLNPNKYKTIDKILFLPDLINYILTSEICSELTIASTTQMLNIKEKKWNLEMLKKFSINENIFPQIIKNKSIIGKTNSSLDERLKETNVDVISVASHDTASAVYLTKAYNDREYAFLSSGTWSLIGCCTEEAIINKEVFKSELTNEIGFDSKNMFFKNITGLYLIERLRKELKNIYKIDFNYSYITDFVTKTKPFEAYIDTDYVDFANEEISIIESMEKYLINTKQELLDDKRKYFRVIYESLVFKYKEIINEIEKIIGYSFKGIHIIGGGAKAEFLCQMIADGLNKKVLAGPYEATAIGNILAQLSVVEGKKIDVDKIIKNTYKVKEYLPKNCEDWIKQNK
ncbi:rhamnulokinase [Miniphocaeibacter halophilus]|uniref:Rhamnulokinase n=1 Tax=Miniphocaeibacter halophilus TaxID=2931922 RepID=A0AC61MS33_9FIRM|nr:FGGY family carbohydrate kinase [Miniphocaeibacter halophilus]QQK08407.1 rhamnulokinase [Miniphocaeibacter halophilus]